MRRGNPGCASTRDACAAQTLSGHDYWVLLSLRGGRGMVGRDGPGDESVEGAAEREEVDASATASMSSAGSLCGGSVLDLTSGFSSLRLLADSVLGTTKPEVFSARLLTARRFSLRNGARLKRLFSCGSKFEPLPPLSLVMSLAPSRSPRLSSSVGAFRMRRNDRRGKVGKSGSGASSDGVGLDAEAETSATNGDRFRTCMKDGMRFRWRGGMVYGMARSFRLFADLGHPDESSAVSNISKTF